MFRSALLDRSADDGDEDIEKMELQRGMAMATHVSGWKVGTVAAVWGGAVLLVLQVHQLRLPGTYEHSVCGLWGCGPPLQALLAMHGFWLVLLSLPVGLCCGLLAPRRLLAVSLLAVVLGTAGIAGVVAWEAEHWLPIASELQRDYFLQRCLFAVGTMTDVPLVQFVLAGFVGSVCAWWRGPRARKTQERFESTVSRFEQIPSRELLTTTRREG
jgi:hypothetical protein